MKAAVSRGCPPREDTCLECSVIVCVCDWLSVFFLESSMACQTARSLSGRVQQLCSARPVGNSKGVRDKSKFKY